MTSHMTPQTVLLTLRVCLVRYSPGPMFKMCVAIAGPHPGGWSGTQTRFGRLCVWHTSLLSQRCTLQATLESMRRRSRLLAASLVARWATFSGTTLRRCHTWLGLELGGLYRSITVMCHVPWRMELMGVAWNRTLPASSCKLPHSTLLHVLPWR